MRVPAPRPVLLERRILPKVWGGATLAGMLGIRPPAGESIGETWEVYDRPEGSSVIRGGDGETLADLLADDRTAWLGRGVETAPDGRFPLLTKFIDAGDALSVQVHPDAELAAGTGDGPKHEAWLVLDAGADGRIVRGFCAGVTREQVAAAAGTAAIEPLLNSFRPQPGDVVPIDAGVVHALGPDVVVFEVQQNSDITWRLWDWGRPREIHIEAALRAVRVDDDSPATLTPERIDDRSSWLVRSPYFRMRRSTLREPATLSTEGTFKIMTVLDGLAVVGWRSGGNDPPLQLRRGDSALIPAVTDIVFTSPVGGLDFLWIDPGESA
jgi:mannose-6-phosphate isomerase